jgi:hypothetical protein
MKRLHQTLLTFVALSGFALATHATVIVDNTWADGIRTNWNLPAESPWYSWTTGSSPAQYFIGVQTNALYLTNTAGVTHYFWTYFTSNANELTISGTTTNTVSDSTNIYFGYPVALSAGQILQVTLVFSLSDVLLASGTSPMRFALTDYDTNNVVGALNGRVIRDTSQITKSAIGVSGYRLNLPVYQTLANNPMFGLMYRFADGNTTDEQDPLGKAGVWTTLDSGPALTNYSGFQPGTVYTLVWAVQCYASSNVLSASLSGGSFTNLNDPTGSTFTNFFSYSVVDTSGSNYQRFDSFMMRFDSANIPTDIFIVNEFKVEVLPFNFPITVVDKFNTDSCRLKWNTLAGQNYTVQCKTNLTDPSWTTLQTLTATTTTLTWTNTGLTGIGQLFYRVANTP